MHVMEYLVISGLATDNNLLEPHPPEGACILPVLVSCVDGSSNQSTNFCLVR